MGLVMIDLLSILFFLLIAFVVLSIRRRPGDFNPLWIHRPQRRHPITRAIYGILGLGILATVAIGTWVDAKAHYLTDPTDALGKIHLPVHPSPPLPSVTAKDIQKGRFLLHFVLVEVFRGELLPIQAREYDLRLPDDRGKELRSELKAPGYTIDFTCSIDTFFVTANKENAVVLNPLGQYSLKIHRFLLEDSSSGTFNDSHIMDHFSRELRPKNPLSIAPSAPGLFSLFCFPTPVSDEDPLREVPLTDFVCEREAEIRASLWPVRCWGISRGHSASIEPGAMGLQFLNHIGVTSLLLLIAALLLSQLFLRKALSFAGWLAAMVIFVGAMDRATLEVHGSRLVDPQVSVSARKLACVRMTDTFFFRKTALEKVEQVLKDDREALGDTARTIHAWLQRSGQ